MLDALCGMQHSFGCRFNVCECFHFASMPANKANSLSPRQPYAGLDTIIVDMSISRFACAAVAVADVGLAMLYGALQRPRSIIELTMTEVVPPCCKCQVDREATLTWVH